MLDIVRSVGLPADEATRVLRERRWRDAVDADWQKSRAYGVTAVPTFVSGGYGVVGAQPYATLERFLSQSGARPRDVRSPA